MSIYSLAPLLSSVAYAILTLFVFRKGRTRMRTLFGVYLLISMLHTFSTFLALSGMWVEYLNKWIVLFNLFGMLSLIAYYHFVSSFTHKSGRRLVILGYFIVLGSVLPLGILGFLPKSAKIVDEGLVVDYGTAFSLVTSLAAVYVGLSIYLLIRRLRSLRDAQERSRVIYLLAGIICFVLVSLREAFPPLPKYPIAQIGHLINASFIAYAIYKHRLLDTKLVIRKGITYAGITGTVTLLFMLLLFTINDWLDISWSTAAGLGMISFIVVLLAAIFNPMKVTLEKMADRMIYGSRYDFRKMVLNVASRLSNVIELDELADAILGPILNAVSASQVSLLFVSGKYYTARFAKRIVEDEPVIPVSIRRDSPIIMWLEREGKPLHRENIDIEPEFKGLWQEDKNNIDAAQLDVLCPITSKHKLVAVLALSKKHPRGYYGNDDLDLLMTLAHEAAVAIENAQLYEKAKYRANTDELTGLFNHRHFHQRLDEEIQRSSRFGKIFSLALFDMDHFKNYNDIYGHVAGDDILAQLGKIISNSLRSVDIAFRYGGDEFGILMPETTLDSAKKMVERLRKSIESQTDLKGIPQTCSFGIATWPTDGVMREEIIHAADAALYHAKQQGGNRFCLACEVAMADVLRTSTLHELQDKNVIIETIYALAATVDAKDHHTYGHSKKVSQYATDIAEALGYSRNDIERIRAAALLHDIGKIGVSDRLLTKREPLLEDDWSLMRTHPSLGVSILKNVDSLRDCLAGVQYHHESFNGKGYPAGLKGENIPMDARILAVADAYDAMTSERPYREGKATEEEALNELERSSGIQFDPTIVKVFTSIRRNTKVEAAKS